MKAIKEIVGKEVASFKTSDGDIFILFTDGDDMRVQSVDYSWRICKGEAIIMSSRDCLAQFVDSDIDVLLSMQCKGKSNSVDLDEYIEEHIESIESCIDAKANECKRLLEGKRIHKVETEKSYDFTIAFSNEIILEVFE